MRAKKFHLILHPNLHLASTKEAVTGHWAGVERALKCGFPERFAQQALGYNSKAVHRAYAKHAEVTVPSLDDWEKDWQENPQRSAQPKLLAGGLRSPEAAIAQSN